MNSLVCVGGCYRYCGHIFVHIFILHIDLPIFRWRILPLVLIQYETIQGLPRILIINDNLTAINIVYWAVCIMFSKDKNVPIHSHITRNIGSFAMLLWTDKNILKVLCNDNGFWISAFNTVICSLWQVIMVLSSLNILLATWRECLLWRLSHLAVMIIWICVKHINLRTMETSGIDLARQKSVFCVTYVPLAPNIWKHMLEKYVANVSSPFLRK